MGMQMTHGITFQSGRSTSGPASIIQSASRGHLAYNRCADELYGKISAIDGHCCARDPRGFITGEIDGESRKILGFAQSPDGMYTHAFLSNSAGIGCFADDFRGEVGLDERRTNRVHADLLDTMIDGHALGEQDESALGSGIRGTQSGAVDAQHRSYVHDRSATRLAHVGQDGSR